MRETALFAKFSEANPTFSETMLIGFRLSPASAHQIRGEARMRE
jgi:hypothetical protein